ncbi:hypothetical protein C9446_19575 [Providencia heimbachae]|nr:hypothetical protein C9446_19575 [Providencia heimbachae]
MYKITLMLSCISFLFLGLEFNYLFIAFAAISIVLISLDFKTSNVQYANLIILLVWLIYFISLYLLGYSRLTNNDPITYVRFLLTIIYFLFISSYFKKYDLLFLISVFCIFTWIAQIIIITHSYYLDSSYYGRGRLFFYQTGEEINSPIIGILLSISLSVFILISNIKFLIKTLMIAISILFLLYIGSRTGLLITLLLLFFSFKIKIKKIIPILCILLLFFIPTIIYIENYIIEIQMFTENLSQRGVESPRYSMWIQGVSNLFNYPFGGMSFNVPGYKGVWFHNIFLDTARTSGIIPLIILMVLFSYYIVNSIITKNKQYLIINLIIILSLMSDVIIEGGGAIRLIFLLIIFNSFMLVRKN